MESNRVSSNSLFLLLSGIVLGILSALYAFNYQIVSIKIILMFWVVWQVYALLHIVKLEGRLAKKNTA